MKIHTEKVDFNGEDIFVVIGPRDRGGAREYFIFSNPRQKIWMENGIKAYVFDSSTIPRVVSVSLLPRPGYVKLSWGDPENHLVIDI